MRSPSGEPVRDAVVYALPEGRAPQSAQSPERVEIDQVDKEFVPHVTAVRAGTRVNFPNRDQIRHHVYSFSSANTFEIPLYAGMPEKLIDFDRPGEVVLGCNIHDWMKAYVFVVDTPYFAVTDSSGEAAIALPAGDYRVEVWHPQSGRRARADRAASRLKAGEKPRLDFTIEQKRVWARGAHRQAIPTIAEEARALSLQPSRFQFRSFRARILTFVIGGLLLVLGAVLLSVHAANLRGARRHVTRRWHHGGRVRALAPGPRADPRGEGPPALFRFRVQAGRCDEGSRNGPLGAREPRARVGAQLMMLLDPGMPIATTSPLDSGDGAAPRPLIERAKRTSSARPPRSSCSVGSRTSSRSFRCSRPSRARGS